MHGLDERDKQGKMTGIDEEHRGVARGHDAQQDRPRRSAVKWRRQFYNERRGILARYPIDAPFPAEAVRLGWKAVLAEHPSTPRETPTELVRARRAHRRSAR